MADGRDDAPGYSIRKAFGWTEIFRCFQVALDPRKLVVAAAGILAMSLGWFLLSLIFWHKMPDRAAPEYQDAAIQSKYEGENLAGDALKERGDRDFRRDLEAWRVLDDMAGPGGRLRTMPWDEYRGPNPYLLISDIFSGNAAQRSVALPRFLTETVPVMIEPLAKLFLPLFRFIDPAASPLTRFYLLLCLAWSLAVWAFFGGIITRIAAVQLAGKDRVTLKEAVQFVVARYGSYILSPLVPLGVVAVIVIGLILYGMVALIPVVGDIFLYGLLMPLIFLAGLVMAVLIVGLVGYPLMYATISTEGSDTFDALSRSYNYVFQAPWSYAWYSLVAIAYGAVVTLFVVFMASLSVYLGKWAISQAFLTETTNRRPDYLFIYSPDSFGWRELFLKGTPAEVVAKAPEAPTADAAQAGPRRFVYVPENPAAAQKYRDSLWTIEKIGAGMVAFWLALAFMLMLGFSYSFFWSAATMIYLLMRKKVDETELDEIYLEEELPEAPVTPPAINSGPAPAGGLSLPTVSAPPSAPAAEPPAPPTLPFSGAAAPPIPLVDKVDVPPGGTATVTASGAVSTTPAKDAANGSPATDATKKTTE